MNKYRIREFKEAGKFWFVLEKRAFGVLWWIDASGGKHLSLEGARIEYEGIRREERDKEFKKLYYKVDTPEKLTTKDIIDTFHAADFIIGGEQYAIKDVLRKLNRILESKNG